MVGVSPEMVLVFSLVVGVGLFVVYGAQAVKVQFSLGTIFLMITVACVGLAIIVTFGRSSLSFFGWLLMVTLPPLNFTVVALLVTTIVHTRSEQQAVSIGRLVPLGGLAIADTIRIGGLLMAVGRFHFGSAGIYLFVCILAYLTALISGYACKEAFRKPSTPARRREEDNAVKDEPATAATEIAGGQAST